MITSPPHRNCYYSIYSIGPHRGVPNVLMQRNNQAAQIDAHLIPEPIEALQLFESHGGHITVFSPFGQDPLEERPDLSSQREARFLERFPDFGPFFHSAVNNDFTLFRAGLLYFIDVSKSFEDQVSAL